MRIPGIILVLAASLLFSVPGWAQDEDFGKSAVARSMMQRASERQSQSEGHAVRVSKPAAPYEMQESIPEDVDTLMARVEAQNGALVEEFEQLLEKDPLNPNAPRWLSEVAEFHWQTAHYGYLRARRAWLAQLDACADDESKCPSEPVADYSKAIADYRRILSQYPSYAQMDDILFRLGDALIRNQQPKEGIGYLHRLTQNYPNYRDLDAAYLAMGEFYFSQKNTGTAQAAYQTLIDKYPKSAYFQYAQYKLAWTYLNLGDEDDYRKAIDLFKQVVESIDSRYASAIDAEGQIDENKLNAGEVSFRNQALNDLSTTFAELPGGWKLAREYLISKLPEEKARDKVEQLGGILDSQGKFEEEVELYHDLISENPTHPHLLQWYKASIEAYKQSNVMTLVDQETRRAIAAVLPDSTWYRANETNSPKEIQKARQFCTHQIYTIAMDDIASIEKTPAEQHDAIWKDAEDMLRTELKYFDEGTSSFDIHYSFAYVLDERSDAALEQLKKTHGKKLTTDPGLASDVLVKLKEAAQAYQTIIDWPETKDEQQGEQIRVAANRQVFVYANILATSDPEWSIVNSAKSTHFVEEKRGSDIHEKEPLTEAEQGFVRSAEQYASRYPLDEETPAFLWRAAEIYRAHYDYDQAAQRFDGIVTNFPDHQYAAVSVGSMFELYNKARNYEKIEYWAKWLILHKNFKHYTAQELENTASFAIDKQAVNLAENGNIGDAVTTLMRIEEAFPNRREHVTAARFKAASFEESRKGYAAAVTLLKPLETQSDTPKHGLEATYRIAENQFRIARYEEAAASFERAAAGYFDKAETPATKPVKGKKNAPKSEVPSAKPDEDTVQNAANSIYYGIQILRSLGESDRAKALLEKYLSVNTHHQYDLFQTIDNTSIPLLTRSIAILEKASLESESSQESAAKILQTYADTEDFSKENEAIQRRILLQWAQYAVDNHNGPLADRALTRLKPDEATWPRAELARHAYLSGRRAQIDFEDVVLEFPIRTLRKRIEDKAKKRQNAEALFKQAISFKNASVSTAAAYEIAQMALHFRDAFKNLPPPKELENDPDGLDEYNVWIEDELIFPAEDAAASLLEIAHQITLQLESYTRFARKSAQTLAELKPDEYPVSESSFNPQQR